MPHARLSALVRAALRCVHGAEAIERAFAAQCIGPHLAVPHTLQILGLTATPTSKDSLAATLAGMRELARNLAAEYVVVSEKDEELLVSSCVTKGVAAGGWGSSCLHLSRKEKDEELLVSWWRARADVSPAALYGSLWLQAAQLC